MIAFGMSGISHDINRWQREDHQDSSSLWQQLAVHLWQRRNIRSVDRFWLGTVFRGNRRNVQNIYRRIIGQQLFADVDPLLA
ncbi:unnamed protein product, partial [Allacma fusca]